MFRSTGISTDTIGTATTAGATSNAITALQPNLKNTAGKKLLCGFIIKPPGQSRHVVCDLQTGLRRFYWRVSWEAPKNGGFIGGRPRSTTGAVHTTSTPTPRWQVWERDKSACTHLHCRCDPYA
jgi:hypothetical protein